ncbi:hypothetical protein [Vagococcus fluvialis]|uniref:hypothetical protein n=1 Tax=Vagococcus fluvialis TaxID=2738 RepID=UPI001D09D9C8|nr:hypothetical protein [Vagococcus fluvialis]UDM79587.1 hypothetical protein K5K97_12980 [Vagococcus fluvialis]
MGFKINGLDELKKNLEELGNNVKSLDGTHSVPFDELFLPSFMVNNTDFSNIDEFVNKSGFDFSNMESISEEELNEFVTNNTSFDSWDSMKVKATEEWTSKKLGF